MSKLTTINNYEEIFLKNIPLLDVRAPIEFNKGAFPNAKNCPITNDDERHLIGTYFKKHGREKAIEYGNKLVSGETKKQRIDAWKEFIEAHPDGALYCFRGGLRSHIAQQWIYEELGIDYPLIEGGYKALRNFLINELENISNWISPVRIGGRTGVGKTKLLLKLKDHIDLEGIANHRGSSFGKRVRPQPTQINFENNLAVKLLEFRFRNIKFSEIQVSSTENNAKARGFQKFHIPKSQSTVKIYLEDEGRNIGRVSIPEKTYKAFRKSPLVVLDISTKERVNLTFDEYITSSLNEYQQEYGQESGFEKWRENIETSLSNIQKRLGGEKYQKLQKIVSEAMEKQKSTGNGELHKKWIETLLVDYYDPMYDYHVAKLDNEIIFKGNEKEVLNFLKKK